MAEQSSRMLPTVRTCEQLLHHRYEQKSVPPPSPRPSSPTPPILFPLTEPNSATCVCLFFVQHDTAASCGASSTTASSSSVAPQASSGSGPSTSTTAKGHASSSSASTSTSARATASAGSSKSSIMFHGDFAIDLADRNNPLCCTEYVNDMYAHFRTVEVRPNQNTLPSSLDLPCVHLSHLALPPPSLPSPQPNPRSRAHHRRRTWSARRILLRRCGPSCWTGWWRST